MIPGGKANRGVESAAYVGSCARQYPCACIPSRWSTHPDYTLGEAGRQGRSTAATTPVWVNPQLVHPGQRRERPRLRVAFWTCTMSGECNSLTSHSRDVWSEQ